MKIYSTDLSDKLENFSQRKLFFLVKTISNLLKTPIEYF